jgi:hypothetical protein
MTAHAVSNGTADGCLRGHHRVTVSTSDFIMSSFDSAYPKVLALDSCAVIMAHYHIFRHHLAIKYPAMDMPFGSRVRGDSYLAVEVGDVGFICDGRILRLFNVLLPA